MGDGPKKGVWSTVGSGIVKYGQTIVMLGGIIFTSGSVWGEVKDVKGQLDKVQVTQVQQAAMTVEIKNLKDQISESKETQKITNENLSKLAEAVNNLSVQVARQEGRSEKRR